MVIEKWESKPYRLVVQRQRRTDNIQEIWEGEYTYRRILTNDFKSDIRDIVKLFSNTFPLLPNGLKHPGPTDSIFTLKILHLQ